MNEKALTLSIVIPVYNEEHHLKACLDAIANQQDSPDEVIVVDNNSSDSSVTVARAYPFVTLLHEPKQSVLYARNKGFNAVKNDIIARIDADTILSPDWVKVAKAYFKKHLTAAITGPVAYYDMPLPTKNYWIDHQIRNHLYKGAPDVPFLFGSNMAIRRSAWLKVRNLVCDDNTVHEDLDLAIHLKQIGLNINYCKFLLASTSSRRYDDTLDNFNDYMRMYRQTYLKHNINSKAPFVATGFYWVGYISLQPYRWLLDEDTGKFSLKQLAKPKTARKNPMS